MRLKIKFSSNTLEVPVQHQTLLNSYIHSCLGRNNQYHDGHNNYSISHMYGGKLDYKTNNLIYNDGGYFIVTSADNEFLNKMLVGVLNNPISIGGMKFITVEHIDEYFYNGWNHFATLSPFLLKRKDSKRFVTLKDGDLVEKLENQMIKKLLLIDNTLDLSDFKINIPNHKSHKVKKILVKNVINHANQCQISIFTNKKVAKLIYNLGLGQSTGSGFGTIYKTENVKLYK